MRKVLRWIAKLIITRNWFALLILLIVLVYVLFTPPELNVFSMFGWLGEDRGGLVTALA